MAISTLSDDFNLASLKLAKEADRLKILDHNYSMLEDGAESIGRIPVNQVSSHSNSYSKDKKKDDVLTQLLIRLQNTRLFLLNQMQELQEVIDQLVDDRDEVIKMRDGLNEFLDHWENTGHYDLDQNNRPNNPMVLKAIKKWEEENNTVFDFDQIKSAEKIAVIIKALQEQETILDTDIQKNLNELDVKVSELKVIDLAIDDMHDGNVKPYSDLIQYEKLAADLVNQTQTSENNQSSFEDVTFNFDSPKP